MNIDQVIRKLTIGSRAKLVIAIDGYSGAGKTRLLKLLARRNKAVLPVYIDDFINTGEKRRALLSATQDTSTVVELEWNNVKKIRQLLHAYRTSNQRYPMTVYNKKTDRYDREKIFDLSKKVLILEGIFLFHPKLYKNVFDVRIFLDVHRKTADARRIRREKGRWGKKYVPEGNPDSYTYVFKIAWLRYIKQYRPKKLADYVMKV